MTFFKLLAQTTIAIIILSGPISVGLYYLYNQIQIDNSDTSYSLKICISYLITYEIGIVYTWIILIWFSYKETCENLRSLINIVWQNHYPVSYPIIAINEVFSLLIALHGAFDSKFHKYTEIQLFFYASSFFICNHVYSIYSRNIIRRNDLQQLPNCHKRIFQNYEYIFYCQSLIIFVCFYYAIKYDQLEEQIKPLIQFLINHLMYHVFEITKIYYAVNIFVFIQFLQVIMEGCNLLKEIQHLPYIISAVTILSIIIAFIYNFYILVNNLNQKECQFYLQLRNCRNGTFFNDINPTQNQTTALRDEDLEKLEVKSFDSKIEQHQKRTQAIDIAQLEDHNIIITIECSVCRNDFQKRDKVIELNCHHIFHQSCLVPWLKEKNNCPNCRREALKTQQ